MLPKLDSEFKEISVFWPLVFDRLRPKLQLGLDASDLEEPLDILKIFR
jgi:hypothetical protein